MRALVTGGVGRVGEAIVRRLEGDGWTVFAAGRAQGDVSRPGEARALVERAVQELGGLDLLVNAAGEGFAPKAVRAARRGGLGRGLRRDRERQLLRHAGCRAGPA